MYVRYDLAGIDGLVNAWIIPVIEEFIAFIGSSSLSTQSMVSGRHILHMTCPMEVSQILPPRARTWDQGYIALG